MWYAPSALVVVVRLMPFSVLVAVTLAPAITASFGSVMIPFRVALATSTCPHAVTVQSEMSNKIRKAELLVCIVTASYSEFSIESLNLFPTRRNVAQPGEYLAPITGRLSPAG
jgi:hypothetical protein